METERSPLRRSSVPRYTFLGGGSPSKDKFGKFQCCFWIAFVISLVVLLVVLLSYFLTAKTSSSPSQDLDGLLRLQWPLQEENYTELSGDSNEELKAFEVGAEGLKEKDAIEGAHPSVEVDSPSFRHQLATPTTQQAQEMSRLGFVFDLASREINKWYPSASPRHSRGNTTTRGHVHFSDKAADPSIKPRRWRFPSEWFPPCQNETFACFPSPYRTANGTCNNLKHPTWGAALHPFRRILLPKYEDGISDPRGGDANVLPSARAVSLAVHRPDYQSDANFTLMLAVWGQFIDHDITATALSKGKNGSAIKCCQVKRAHPECFPVLLDPSDPFNVQYNVSCMEFVRSAPAPTCTLGPREQLNQATSFIDGSVVYGNDETVMNQLRTLSGGELKMLKHPTGDLLPISQDLNDGCNRKEEFEKGRYCFLSGDKRSNENLLLTSMHLLFARQHNIIVKKLSEVNPKWSDEKLFQETRKIISAGIQHITYNEFLPSVLPEELMVHLNLSAKRSGRADLYNSSVDPTIANVFASAAFRFGHTLLPGLMRYLRSNSTREEYLELHKMLFNPFEMFEREFLESVMKGAMNTSSGKADVHFTRELTQKLFQKEPKNPCGLDLVSLNIQRGRDHGLPSYPNWRTVCGLKKPENFDDLKNDVEAETLAELKNLYKSVDDVDLYTGGLAEKPVRGGLVGPTITCLIADQFLRLKIGDRYWYERTEGPQRFTPRQLNEIRKISLAKIICATSGVMHAQPHVMRKAGTGNELKPCEEFSYPDFEPWREI